MHCSKCNQPFDSLMSDGLCTDGYHQAVVRNFIDYWNISMPYHDIGPALNCIECNALHKMLLAFGELEAAQALIESHAAGDEEGDNPEHLRIRGEITVSATTVKIGWPG